MVVRAGLEPRKDFYPLESINPLAVSYPQYTSHDATKLMPTIEYIWAYNGNVISTFWLACTKLFTLLSRSRFSPRNKIFLFVRQKYRVNVPNSRTGFSEKARLCCSTEKKKKKGNFFLVCSLPIRRDARNIRTDMAVPADSPEQLQDSEFFKDVGWRYSLEYSVRQKHK